jgi:hypothetical protein
MRFERRENPPPKKKYQDCKPYLRKDFKFRCAYCLIHEAHFGGLRNFHVDHFRPKSRDEFRHLELVYTNLYYSCALCNTFKRQSWPSTRELDAGFRFVDPCEEDLYERHVEVNGETGELRALTRAGEYTVAHIWLDRAQMNKHRRMLIEKEKKWQDLRNLLNSKSLPPATLAKARELMNELEREFFAPHPPYDPADLET